ncbi:MAG: tRNA (adenosine(37)-N6)-dimethylallyltransferase MiaA [Kiritimatiellae bacterium]|nr:tRNA (adenosine(37)-N6)-dimethylallyltransferase MiaA [Kiritimatiellia bacterium]
MICILGPTAIGKTHVAIGMARKMGGEIISADSRQVYRRMDIGTGKDLDEYSEGGAAVSYHLIDIVEPGTEFNLYEYQQEFIKAYDDVRNRKKLPILCGGTGLYVDAVLKGYHLVKVDRDDVLRTELEGDSEEELVKRLKDLKALHNTTDTRDRERLIRAIEIATHTRDSAEEDNMFPKIETQVYGLRMDRVSLKRRITERLRHRLEHGMIDEVAGLLDSGLTAEQLMFYGLEYRFVTQHVLGELNRNDMFQKLREAIYQFARRQEKWFRRMERQGTVITWLDADQSRSVELQ